MLKPRPNSESEALVPAGEFLTRALAAYQLTPGRVQEHSEPSVPLTHYLWVLRRYRWQMLGFVAACTIAAFLISSRMHPIYESTSTLDVDRQSGAGVVGEDSKRLDPMYDSDQYMATQIRLVESDSVIRPVALKYKLLDRERELSLFGGMRQTPGNGPIKLRRLTVTRPPNTYLIQISYRSSDPVLAANVANAVAASYLEHTYEIRARASSNLSRYMERQLDELRAKMERSEMALAQFEKELNVINPEEKTSILSARLLQLNQEYTNAQADRMKKEATYDGTQSGSLAAAQVSAQGEALTKLTERLNEASEKFAQVKEQYGPNHPEYIKAAVRVKELQQQLDNTRKSVGSRTEVEYREALNREMLLKSSVGETKAEFDRLNEHSYEYQNLRQEADADKKLYEELVRKIKEASINSGFESRAVRLADNALPADKPVSPNTPLNVILSFVFATFLAVGGAVMADTLDKTISDPEQVTTELRSTLIGTLPMSRGWKFPFGAQELESPNGALVKADNNSTSSRMLEESIRVLHSSILLSDLDRRIRSVLITSASPHEGKSTTAALLATVHAQQGKKTLLIDGDMRRPTIDRVFGIGNSSGLSNVVLGELGWKEAIIHSAKVPKLDILTSGPPSHRALDVMGSAIESLLEEAAREYSLIVVDSAPLMNFAEPLQLATYVDGVAIVSVAGETNRRALGSVISRLTRLRANVLGVVLNKVTKDMTDSYAYYGYGGKYASRYYRPDAEEQSNT